MQLKCLMERTLFQKYFDLFIDHFLFSRILSTNGLQRIRIFLDNAHSIAMASSVNSNELHSTGNVSCSSEVIDPKVKKTHPQSSVGGYCGAKGQVLIKKSTGGGPSDVPAANLVEHCGVFLTDQVVCSDIHDNEIFEGVGSAA
ncbi:hypothetical protein KC19_VG154800 [Ceratodon purpureus]|uniref:Uncharacterized protein n=1 Tax=Ceratodon purpureus TaxID=3225 RepID=A0A8T0HR12_CERPU|nr:hypothetical protein KC19_VG154800 [Ceratodon purpureus]